MSCNVCPCTCTHIDNVEIYCLVEKENLRSTIEIATPHHTCARIYTRNCESTHWWSQLLFGDIFIKLCARARTRNRNRHRDNEHISAKHRKYFCCGRLKPFMQNVWFAKKMWGKETKRNVIYREGICCVRLSSDLAVRYAVTHIRQQQRMQSLSDVFLSFFWTSFVYKLGPFSYLKWKYVLACIYI